MNNLIHEQSDRVNTEELDLWTVPATACAITSRRTVDCPLVNSIENSSALEFRYSHQRAYLDLYRSSLYVKLTIRDQDGAIVDVKDDPKIAFINLIGATLFSKLQLFIGGKLVEESGGNVNHAYRAFLETELFSDSMTKNSLDGAGYTFDSSPENSEGSGHNKRVSWAKGKKAIEFVAPINLSMFRQRRLLLNFIDLKLVAYLNDADFVLEQLKTPAAPAAGTVAPTYTYKIEAVKLRLQECEIADSAMIAIENTLRATPARYPINSVQMRSFFIGNGCLTAPEHRFINSSIPKLVVLGLVDKDNYHGTLSTNPFVFKNFGVQEAFLTVGGKSIPARMSLDWEQAQWMDAFTQFQDGLGVVHCGNSNGITREMFSSCSTFFVFEISPYLHSDAMSLLSLGTTSVTINFKKALKTDCYAILMSMFDDIVEIDANREIHQNTVM